MVTIFMFQEMKYTEILKEKLWEAEKCSPPPQDTHFLVPAICASHLIWHDRIWYDKVKGL